MVRTYPVMDRYECGSGDFQNLIALNVNCLFCGPIGVGRYLIYHFRGLTFIFEFKRRYLESSNLVGLSVKRFDKVNLFSEINA